MSSSRTTLAGYAIIITSVGGAMNLWFDGNPATTPDWNQISTAVIAGLGLIYARDHKTTDEAAGLKPEEGDTK
jgi:hypothetical protein